MRFVVYVPEIHIRTIVVEATSATEAKELAKEIIECGDENEILLEYSHTKDMDDWDAFEE